MDGRTAQRPQLHAKHLRPRKREPDPAQAQEWIALAIDRQAGNWLVAAGIEGADRHRPSRSPFENAPIDGILRILVGQAPRSLEQKLRPHEADAVADGGIEARKIFGRGNIEQDGDAPAIGRQRRLEAAGIGSDLRGIRGRHAVLEQAARFGLGIEDHGAGVAVDQRQ